MSLATARRQEPEPTKGREEAGPGAAPLALPLADRKPWTGLAAPVVQASMASTFRPFLEPRLPSSAADRAAAALQQRALDPMKRRGASLDPHEDVRDEGEEHAVQLAPLERPSPAIQAQCAADCACAKCSAARGLAVQRADGPSPSPVRPSPAQALGRLGGGSLLPPSLASQFSLAFGRDLGNVQIHTENALATDMRARAFTVGHHVAFAPGEYQPGTSGGDRLIGHELAHVVQQSGGAGAVQAAGLSYDGYEAEADAAADKALSGGQVAGLSPVSAGMVQRQDPPQASPDASSSGVRVWELTPEEFENLTGAPASTLPDGQYVPGAQVQQQQDDKGSTWPIVLGAAATKAPMPGLPVPAGSTGVLVSPGHVSDFAVSEGGMAIRGFRSNFWQHVLSHSERNSPLYQKLFNIGPGEGPETIALNQGVPGNYYNDWFYPYMPGTKAVWRPNDNAGAEVDFLRTTPETLIDPVTGQPMIYRFSPPGPNDPYYQSSYGDMEGFGQPGFCPPGVQNCATEPMDVHERLLGGEPEMVGPDGTPLNPLEGGSMRTIRRWAADSEALGEQGLTSTPTAGAMWARAGVGFIKAGGVVLMVYGGTKSIIRIANAPDDQMGTVVGEEAGSWGGGFVGNVVGSALGGAFVCSETGPGAFFCAVGFGIAGGATGSVIGGSIGHDVGEAFDNWSNMTQAQRNEAIACYPDWSSDGCRAFHEMQAIERGDNPDDVDPMTGF